MDKIQILLKNANLNQKFEKIFKKLTSKIAKPSDLMFYFSIFVLWNIPIVILKNYHHDVKRVMNNYLPGLTFLIAPTYEKMRWTPFALEPPKESLRDSFLFKNYEARLKKIYDHNTYHHGFKTLGKDHLELDTTKFDWAVYLNVKRIENEFINDGVNQIMVKANIPIRNKEYIYNDLETRYSGSNYKYRDDLYKELKELVEI